MKEWFNQHFPYYRLCVVAWCFRGQVYEHRCYRHAARTEKEN